MQFTLATLSALLATALTIGASPLEARQSGGIRATFFNNGGFCGPEQEWADDTYFVQNPVGVCSDLGITNPFTASYFNQSTITRTLRFYTVKCNERFGNQVNHVDVAPGLLTPGCKAQHIESWETI